MLKILVTYAVQGEFVEIKWPDVEPYYIRTGIGKVKSAFHLAEAIRQVQPDLVLNLGSAGTVNHQVGDIFVCRKFIDRDMQKLAGLGMECEIDSSALLETKGFCKHWTEEGICNTGDGFLTELTHVSGDVVDMEAYAQAFVCRSKEIPFGFCEVRDRHYRTKLRETLGGQTCRRPSGAFELFQCLERKNMIGDSCRYQSQKNFHP